MIYVNNMYELYDILTDFDEDSTSRSFVGNETEVMGLLSKCNEFSSFLPDTIQFNSEDEDYYVFSLDKIDDEVFYTILPAINENTGKFYGCKGDLFVSTTVPDEFEKDANSYVYIKSDSITRISIKSKENDSDKNNIFTVKSDCGITQSWSDGDSYYSRSYFSSDAKNLENIAKEWNDFAQRLQNRG